MNLAIFFIFAFICLFLLVALEEKFGRNIIYLFGIGSIINASLFHQFSLPFVFGDITFGMDFFLQPLFFVCLFVMLKTAGTNSTRTMLNVSVLSLWFSAIVEFLTLYLNNSSMQTLAVNKFLGLIASGIIYFACGQLLIFLQRKAPEKTNNFFVFISIVLINIITIVLLVAVRSFEAFNYFFNFIPFFALCSIVFVLFYILFSELFKKLKTKK